MIAKLLAKLLRRPAEPGCLRCAVRERTAPRDTTWSVRPLSERCGRPSGRAMVSGPALLTMAQELLTDLAMSILDGDGRAEAWGDWLTALSNVRAAERDGEPLGTYLDAVEVAWDGLTPEIGCDLYLPLLDALSLGRQMEQTAGAALAKIGRAA